MGTGKSKLWCVCTWVCVCMGVRVLTGIVTHVDIPMRLTAQTTNKFPAAANR